MILFDDAPDFNVSAADVRAVLSKWTSFNAVAISMASEKELRLLATALPRQFLEYSLRPQCSACGGTGTVRIDENDETVVGCPVCSDEYGTSSQCCFCGTVLTGQGKDPQPVCEGRCCADCYQKIVIPALIRGVEEEHRRAQYKTDAGGIV